jgi:hypothetical protein
VFEPLRVILADGAENTSDPVYLCDRVNAGLREFSRIIGVGNSRCFSLLGFAPVHTVSPESPTTCDQQVNQAASASG